MWHGTHERPPPSPLLPVPPPPPADPAAEAFTYPVSIDVRDLVSLDDVMEELQLGPNGWVHPTHPAAHPAGPCTRRAQLPSSQGGRAGGGCARAHGRRRQTLGAAPSPPRQQEGGRVVASPATRRPLRRACAGGCWRAWST